MVLRHNEHETFDSSMVPCTFQVVAYFCATMKVDDNTLLGLKGFFDQSLMAHYDARELANIFAILCEQALNIPYQKRRYDGMRVSESDLLYFFGAIKRLQKNEPIQYVVGHTYFYGLKMDCSPAALIPRPETEELVHWVLQDAPRQARIIDYCTGSGCIALAIKQHLPSAMVQGIDLSEQAITLAKHNAAQLNLDVTFKCADIFGPVQEPAIFDVIVSNPPYIGKEEAAGMRPHVLDFEPKMALFVEDSDVLIFYRRLADLAASQLVSGGYIAVEINAGLGNETLGCFPEEFFRDIELKADLSGRPRMIKAIRR